MTFKNVSASRSRNMAAIRGRGNKSTELALAAILRRYGITGWRRHRAIRLVSSATRSASGSVGRKSAVVPDFVFSHERTALFVDGCFWHQCPEHCIAPRNNAPAWMTKLSANASRDRYVTKSLRRQGWRVLRIWEHELADETKVARRVAHHLSRSGRY